MVDSDVASTNSLGGRLLITLLKCLGALPLSIRGNVGAAIGRVVGLAPSRDKRIVTEQLNLFSRQLQRAVPPSEVFAHVGRVTLESVNLLPVVKNPDTFVNCHNWNDVTEWLKDDRPLVVLTAHFGNWDLLAAYAIGKGVPLTTIGREARNPALQSGLRWMRERYGVETLWRSDKVALKRLITCLRERKVLAALIDQDTRVESIFTPFFGRPTRTPSSLVALGKKFNARFVYAFLERQPHSSISSPQFLLKTGELPSDATIEEILTVYHVRLEECVRANPAQWVWFHKRWRSLPDGSTMSSREYLEYLKAEQRCTHKS